MPSLGLSPALTIRLQAPVEAFRQCTRKESIVLNGSRVPIASRRALWQRALLHLSWRGYEAWAGDWGWEGGGGGCDSLTSLVRQTVCSTDDGRVEGLVTSSKPSLSAPAPVSSPASLRPLGRNQYLSTLW